MQFLLLFPEQLFEGSLDLGPEHWDLAEVSHGRVDQALVEGEDDEELLDVHLDHGLPDQGGPEEGPEGHEEVAARDPGQVEQGVGDLEHDRKKEKKR